MLKKFNKITFIKLDFKIFETLFLKSFIQLSITMQNEQTLAKFDFH